MPTEAPDADEVLRMLRDRDRSKHPVMTVGAVAELVGASRPVASERLDLLEARGDVDHVKVGNARGWYVAGERMAGPDERIVHPEDEDEETEESGGSIGGPGSGGVAISASDIKADDSFSTTPLQSIFTAALAASLVLIGIGRTESASVSTLLLGLSAIALQDDVFPDVIRDKRAELYFIRSYVLFVILGIVFVGAYAAGYLLVAGVIELTAFALGGWLLYKSLTQKEISQFVQARSLDIGLVVFGFVVVLLPYVGGFGSGFQAFGAVLVVFGYIKATIAIFMFGREHYGDSFRLLVQDLWDPDSAVQSQENATLGPTAEEGG